MERRHDYLLTARLEDALYNGCAHITWEELYLWYGVRKLAAGTFRDLHQRWVDLFSETSANESPQLMMVKGRGGMFIFDGNNAEEINPDAQGH